MLKVCIDTNVWISGVLFAGPPAKGVDLAIYRRRIEVISSTAILRELERNLVGKFGFSIRTVKRLTYRIAEVADLYEPAGEIKLAGISRQDALVLETAILGKAKFLVTGDRRLLALKHFKY